MLTFSMVFIKKILPVTICLVNYKIFFLSSYVRGHNDFSRKAIIFTWKNS